MIPDYPKSVEIHLGLRDILHPMFQKLPDGISEFTFANLYLFQKYHKYRITRLPANSSEFFTDCPESHTLSEGNPCLPEKNSPDNNESGLLLITGCDSLKKNEEASYSSEGAAEEHDSPASSTAGKFFMLPFGMPRKSVLQRLFQEHITMKCASESQAAVLQDMGYAVYEDRDNFDYLYQRENLARLPGRHYHKKRNLIKAFVNNHNYEGRPLLEEYLPDALDILYKWRINRKENGHDDGDFDAAKEALEKSEELQLCGGIYYVGKEPVAYSLGEELACGSSFVIHFEKAVNGYKGLWQFVNQAFASIITEHYETINREQDLGDEGLRHAKLSYHPTGFVRKYKVREKINGYIR